MANRNFMGATKAAILAFLSNMANNGLPFAVQLGTTALAFPDYATAVGNAVDLQTAADTAIAEAQAATNLANAARLALEDTTRTMCAAGRTSTMTDADLLTLGIARRATTNSRVPAPVVAPALALSSLSPGAAVFTYSTPGAAGPRQKPTGAVGVEISLRPIASIQSAETGILQSITKTPSSISTALLPAGTLKACARFYTQSGLKGPWSTDVPFTSQTV